MRSLVSLFFILFMSVSCLYAQETQAEKPKKNAKASIVSIQAVPTQMIKQIQSAGIRIRTHNLLRDVGYGYQKNSNITSSISSLHPTSNQMDGYTNIYQYLEGHVAGVTVLGTRILIRGIHTATGSNEPLVVLNGIELDSSSQLGFINPADVKSIEVLKDAGSTAVYGLKGANGVILITTK